MEASTKSDAPPVHLESLIPAINEATDKDHELTIVRSFKVYGKAIAWSTALSAALIMDGYDFKLFGLLLAQAAFNEKYGKLQSNGKYQISAAWQSGLTNGSNIGQMIGLFLAGYLSDRFGFRKSMMLTLAVIPAIIFIFFFAPNLWVLEIGEILLGGPSCIHYVLGEHLPTNYRHTIGHPRDNHLCLRC